MQVISKWTDDQLVLKNLISWKVNQQLTNIRSKCSTTCCYLVPCAMKNIAADITTTFSLKVGNKPLALLILIWTDLGVRKTTYK